MAAKARFPSSPETNIAEQTSCAAIAVGTANAGGKLVQPARRNEPAAARARKRQIIVSSVERRKDTNNIRILELACTEAADVLARPGKGSRNQRRIPQQARSRLTVDTILDATARILRSRGLAAVTTNNISEVAGIGVATLYGYFPDKTAILVALARRMMAEDETAIIAARAAAPEEDPVRILVRTVLDRHRLDAPVRRVVMSVHHAQGLAAEHTQAAERTITRVLEHDGRTSIPSDLDPARIFVLTRAVLGVARAIVEEGPSRDDRDVIEDELVRLAHLCIGNTAWLAGPSA